MSRRETIEVGWTRWTAADLGVAKGALVDYAAQHPGMNIIRGWASDSGQDLDGERVDQGPNDLGRGTVWPTSGIVPIILEHPDQRYNRLGQTVFKGVPVERGGHLATPVIGGLFRTVPMAQRIWLNAVQIAEAGGEIPWGFSIEAPHEGVIRKGNRLAQCFVSALAITGGPRNERAIWEPVYKGVIAAFFTHEAEETADIMNRLGLSRSDLVVAALAKGRATESRPWGEWRQGVVKGCAARATGAGAA